MENVTKKKKGKKQQEDKEVEKIPLTQEKKKKLNTIEYKTKEKWW